MLLFADMIVRDAQFRLISVSQQFWTGRWTGPIGLYQLPQKQFCTMPLIVVKNLVLTAVANELTTILGGQCLSGCWSFPPKQEIPP